MFPFTLLALLLLLDTPEQPLAPPCEELALYLSGCDRHVLGLSACEQSHQRICSDVFPAHADHEH